ncbi:1-acyl-sn-glycerol-3-phosphate acyltransferase [Allokutzneria sp. NRRL B-24872]|uniref:lysophospholipid acyltransferase family protein n=1 Tax=Allokutzneria sp. NRRL B-24872 TaxID=1137961 RepID=UPI000A3BFB2C|nr:lysophospholipid acyltransferase family protein [Allokutzneria sp. NRRL B-24872]
MAREKGGFWVGVAAAMFYPATRVLARRKFLDQDKLPKEGAVLLVGNHISLLDPPYTAVYVHQAKRVPRFLAKDSLWKIPLLGPILRGAGQIPVSRGTADARNSLEAANKALREGKVVTIFPEGTLSRDPDHWPMVSRTGVARLAVEHCVNGSVPVLPLVHWGTQQVMDRTRKLPKLFPRRTVVVRVGDPLDLSKFQGRALDNELLREVTDHLMGEVRDLLAEVRGEPAPTEFYSPRKARKDKQEEGK